MMAVMVVVAMVGVGPAVLGLVAFTMWSLCHFLMTLNLSGERLAFIRHCPVRGAQ